MNGSPYNFSPIDARPGADAGDPIAIVGLSCRLPGAPDVAAFERLLWSGTDAVTEIPDWRWNKAHYFHPDRGQRGKVYTFAAGVLDDVAGFDAAFFGISPREAVQVDPQQRLALELAHEAIEDAGIDGARLAGTAVGVFVGGSSWDYLNRNVGDPSTVDAYSMTGVTLCSLSNRVSYAFDLRGPSFTVDTACSSSLVALDQACAALRAGTIPAALVGGVSLLLAPQSYVGFCAASMLSPRGRCHAFDARADGYVRAEGGGFVLLKPLREALADGDRIRAVIHGTGVNSDGRTTGFSLPNRHAQAALLRSVYERFALDPARLAYVEAHGTGTPAGDPIEAGALGEVLGAGRARPLPIGSVKTNVGHLEAASGMAGLLKAIVAIERGAIPPSLHGATPNPDIPFERLNLALVPERRAMEGAAATRLVGINSFGFGGTNAHAVLGTAPPPIAPIAADAATMPPLLLSARSDGALAALAGAWRGRLEQPEARLPALLRGAARYREQHGHRLVVTAGDGPGLRAGLEAFLAGRESRHVARGKAVAGRIGFVFSGNGSQWTGMATDAMRGSPAFAAALARVDAALAPRLGWSVTERLETPDAASLRRTDVAQPLLFAIQVALVLALRRHGLEPDACMGHSVGEVAAAWAAGALDLDDAARVIAARSGAQQACHGIGAMGVLGAGPDAAAKLVADLSLGHGAIEIAAMNGAEATTLAGPAEAIDVLASDAAERGLRFSRLDLDYAFHSAAMDPIRATLAQGLTGLAPSPAELPFYSAVTGGAADGEALGSDYWWRNVREPVRFAEAARRMVADGVRLFVEIGPHAVLQAYLNEALREADVAGKVLASLGRRPIEGDPLAIIAGRAHAAGADIRVGLAFLGQPARDGLPPYPWQRERFWLDPSSEAVDPGFLATEHPLLGIRRGAAAEEWTSQHGIETLPWLADHIVGGAAVMPAAALIEMALAAGRARHPGAAIELRDLEINRALVFEPGVLRDVRVRVDGRSGDFEIASRPRLIDAAWTEHAKGRIGDARDGGAIDPLPAPAPARAMDGAAVYARAAAVGLDYGETFRTIRSVVADDAVAEAVLDEERALPGDYLLAPNLVDGAFQALVALATDMTGEGASVLPWRFGRIRLPRAGGARPARARLRITRRGPRSVRADLLLNDAAGDVVAELRDCWFVRATLDQRARAAQPFFRTVWEPSAGAGAGALPPWDLRALLGEDAPDAPETQLLADAYAAAVAMATVRALLPPGATATSASDLIRSGAVAPAARARLDAMLGWLVADGRAALDEAGRATLADEVPLAPDLILRTLLFEAPRAVADVALLAAGARGLADRLRAPDGPRPAAGALWEQFLHDSPAGAAAAEALGRAIERVAGDWPPGRPLRILEVGAGQGRFTRRLLERLPAFARVTATTGADDVAALRETLAAEPRARAVERDAALQMAGAFDLVIGLHALTLGEITPADLVAALAPGGLLLVAEPPPNRVWALADAGAPREATDWRAALAAAGCARTAGHVLSTELWPVAILAAQAADRRDAPRPPMPRVTFAAPGDAALEALIAEGMDRGDGGTAPEANGTPATVWAIPCALALPELLEGVTRHACFTAAGGRADLTLLIRAPAEGDARAAALTGLVRVLANEAPDLACRLIRLDPALPSTQAARHAIAEIGSPDGENEVAWTAAGRSVPRFTQRPVPPTPEGDTPIGLEVARPGLLDSLGWRAAEAPAPGPGEIAIDIAAAGLNFRDVMWAMGLLPDEALLEGFAGAALGLECAGTVRAVGEDVADLRPGDRVMAFAPRALGTRTVTAAHAVMPMPAEMDFAAAATIPVAFLTVAYALGHLARVQPGERVLIHGGAGGVGLAAIQYARARGALVYASAGSPAKRALLASLGVEAVLDSRTLSFADEVMRLTGGEGVDVVLNSLSGAAMERSLGLLRPFGRFLELGKRDFYENNAIRLRPLRHNITYHAIDADQLPLKRPALAKAIFTEIGGLFADGALRPLPHRVFDYGDVQSAFRLMQSAGHIGKIVLVPGAVAPRAPAPSATFAARADRTYIVTGGLRGFGLEAARWLVAHGARALALVGRRGAATPGADTLLAGFAAAGVAARAYACDVADAEAVAAMLDGVRDAQPPIGGVIHAAVVMDDALIGELDEARFAGALGAKLDGAEALDRLTRADPIELFLLFSSVTTMFGNPGQAAYVAANAAIEALAERRHGEGLAALAVQWGPIGDAGYLAREREIGALLERQLGGQHLTAREALDALPALLAAGIPVAGHAPLRWAALRGGLPLLATPLFADLEGQPGEQAGELDLRAMLADLSPEEGRDRVIALLAEEVSRIMKLAPDRIEPHRPLPELGMDSLMAVELRLAVEERFGIAIPVLALSDSATLSAMATRIVASLAAPDGTGEAASGDAVVAQLARFESHEGPADGVPAPAEAGFAAAAASVP